MTRAALAVLSVALLTAAMTPQAARAAASDDVLCAMMAESAKAVNAAGPVAVDAVTTQESVSVDCDARRILTRFSRTDNAADQPQGWQDNWQSQLDAAYCGDTAMRDIIAGGWTFAELTTFADGEEFEIKAACE